jgi:hypothetical protein
MHGIGSKSCQINYIGDCNFWAVVHVTRVSLLDSGRWNRMWSNFEDWKRNRDGRYTGKVGQSERYSGSVGQAERQGRKKRRFYCGVGRESIDILGGSQSSQLFLLITVSQKRRSLNGESSGLKQQCGISIYW